MVEKYHYTDGIQLFVNMLRDIIVGNQGKESPKLRQRRTCVVIETFQGLLNLTARSQCCPRQQKHDVSGYPLKWLYIYLEVCVSSLKSVQGPSVNQHEIKRLKVGSRGIAVEVVQLTLSIMQVSGK